MASIVTESLGPTVGKIFLAIVAIAIASCTLPVQTGAIRLAFAMARDGLLPGSKRQAKVDQTSRTPFWPSVVVGFIAICVLLVNLNHPRVVEAIGSVSVVWINLAYWIVSVALLVRRLQGWPGRDVRDVDGSRLFSLGRFGLPINVMAVIWGLVIVVNTGWPRAEIYGDHFPQRQAAALGTITLLAAGGLYYNLARRTAAQG